MKLTRANSGKTINLMVSADITDEVRYRVQINAPYLSIDKARGSFKTQTALPIKVDTSNIVGRDIPGSVTIYSTLGVTDIPMPLQVGVTGRYHGALRYNGDTIPLGDTRFDLDIIENNGDVSARVAPEHSMLFPQGATSDNVAYGFGSLSGDGSVDLTIDHLLDATAGGAQNHFNRQIGRRIVMHLDASSTGVFDGTFSESVYGLFEGPVKTNGAAHLEFMPEDQDPNFQPHSVAMPSIMANSQLLPLSVATVFNGGPYACPVSQTSTTGVLSSCYNPLRAAIHNVNTKFSELSEDCKAALGLGSTGGVASACGCPTYPACLMYDNANGNDYVGKGPDQGALAQSLVAPAALVAQEEMVQALRDSVAGTGLSTELKHYDTALAALAPVAKWMMQPGMLEFFRNIPKDQAAQPPTTFITDISAAQKTAAGLSATAPDVPPSGSEIEGYPAARALARVVQLLVDANAERQRVASVVTTGNPQTEISQAQYNSVVTYLEAVALIGVLNSWAVAPPSAAASVTGVITKLDHAFTDMTQDVGDNLGTPRRHVPFVYRADDTTNGATNFEQKLTIANKAVAALEPLETSFKPKPSRLIRLSMPTRLRCKTRKALLTYKSMTSAA